MKFDHLADLIKFLFFDPGFQQLATQYLEKFKWGKTFINLNKELLDKYAACKDSTEMVRVQHEYMKQLDEERQRKSIIFLLFPIHVYFSCNYPNLLGEIDLPPSASESEESSDEG